MTTLALQKEIKELRDKLSLLEKAVMTPLDEDGEYKPIFVKTILRRAAEKPKNIFEYKTRGDLIGRLRLK